jgi:hypothetical protein
MIADGLTKVLIAEKFNRFRDQMGLVDIGDKIKDQKDQEYKKDDYEHLFDDEIISDHRRQHECGV